MERVEDMARTESRIAKKKESSSHSRNWGSRQSFALFWQNWKQCSPEQIDVMFWEIRVVFGAQKRRMVLLCRNSAKLNL